MKINEIISSSVIDDADKIIEILPISDQELLNEAYLVVLMVRKESSINNVPYSMPSSRLYDKDLMYELQIFSSMKSQILESRLSSQTQIIRLLDEVLNYFENRY